MRAQVKPTVPAPLAVYNEGSSCACAWTGDTNSTTTWLNMTIELKTGSNLDMVFLTSNYPFFFFFFPSVPHKAKIILYLAVATGLDGTKDNSISFPCPNVTPNSAIYFYQFVAPNAVGGPWIGTGRFAIASAAGVTTAPANPTQPDGSAIPWGTGALVNPSDAIAPPSFDSSNSSSSSIASNSSTSAASTSAAGSVSGSVSGTISGSAALAVTSGVASASPAISLSTSATPTGLSTSGAMSTFDIRVWGAAAAAATLALSLVW